MNLSCGSKTGPGQFLARVFFFVAAVIGFSAALHGAHGMPNAAPLEEVVWIPGGNFWVGSEEPMFPDARPVHQVYVDGFWMDRTTVTNEQFAKFVKRPVILQQPSGPRKPRNILVRRPRCCVQARRF